MRERRSSSLCLISLHISLYFWFGTIYLWLIACYTLCIIIIYIIYIIYIRVRAWDKNASPTYLLERHLLVCQRTWYSDLSVTYWYKKLHAISEQRLNRVVLQNAARLVRMSRLPWNFYENHNVTVGFQVR